MLGGHARTALTSVVALGLAPIIGAAVLVELALLLTRRGRRRRLAGPAARRGIAAATILLAVILAFAQAYFVARWLESLSGHGAEVLVAKGGSIRLLLMTTLAGGTMALAAIAALIGRYGLGNGYAVLIATATVTDVFHRFGAQNGLDAGTMAAAVAAIVAIVAVTIWTVRTTFRGRHRLPLGGTVPMQAAAGVAGVVAIVALALGPWRLEAIVDLLPPRLGLGWWLAVMVGAGAVGAVIAVRLEARRAPAPRPGTATSPSRSGSRPPTSRS